jgi:glycosyltransferase involved in cell wall biosynthesis
MNPLPLSVSIITLNEEHNLGRCLDSVRSLAAEIVVIDSGSTDRTGDIARQAGAHFEFNTWPGHIAQKNFALHRCSQPWVLCLDADEALSPELAGAIRALFAAGEPVCDGYWVNRRTFYLGRWIRHALCPEWKLRLVRRGRACWGGLNPHDHLETEGPTARLAGDLLHYSHENFQDHIQTVINYARIGAASYEQAGKEFRWYKLLCHPWFNFLKRLVIKQAWRDGWRGWILAYVSLLSAAVKYLLLLEKHMRKREFES